MAKYSYDIKDKKAKFLHPKGEIGRIELRSHKSARNIALQRAKEGKKA